jgi:uroporphyrin-III C-methyltransferase/precorrin-2 dehydrogenase/sirohydrochlorin ferrochelatase
VLIATGHTIEHDAADLTAWHPEQTLALYMAIANFEPIAGRLIELGHRLDLPLAIIENGTTAEQRVICSTLERLPGLAAEHQVRSPALLLIGETVRYAERYAWFNPKLVKSKLRDTLAEVS